MIDRKIFFDSVRASLFGGSLSTGQVDGMEAILAFWESTYRTLDMRFIAYSQATAYHETDKTMQPIEEYGHGAGHPYGLPTGPWHQVYDGNGLAQLTWLANYQKAQDRLTKLGLIGPEIDIVKNPALARRLDIAVKILVMGMMEGWFTYKRLPEYFNQIADDPIGARHIINGTDRANLVAMYHGKFLDALKASEKPATAPTPIPAPVPPKPSQTVPAPQSLGPLAAFINLIVLIIQTLFKGKPK